MPIDKAHVECLILAQAFETLWAYYLQSDGELFSEECRKAALQFLDSFEQLSKCEPKFMDPVALSLGENIDVKDIVQHFRRWLDGEDRYPYDQASGGRFILWGFFAGVKGLLITDLGLSRWPIMVMSSEEAMHTNRVVRWRGHLPSSILRRDTEVIFQDAFSSTPRGDLEAIFQEASSSMTIVVVADIRRSQDLMTYATTPVDYSTRMVHFISTTRQSIDQHHGFFDKFTGDGYLVYFNEAICKAADVDYTECFLDFLKEQKEFSADYFREWSRNVRKLPSGEVGLAIGADLGIVEFHDIENNLVAVGDSVVWASRMASIASANEVIVNNLLFCALEELPGIQFEQRSAETKAGEDFLARSLEFERMA